MLTLRRRKGESVMIGPDIEVRIASIRAGEVMVNIDAPKSVAVDRKEVRDGVVPRRRSVTAPPKGSADA